MNLKFNKFFFGGLATLILFFVLFFLFSGLLRVNAQGAPTKQIRSTIVANAGTIAITNIRELETLATGGILGRTEVLELRLDVLEVANPINVKLDSLALTTLPRDLQALKSIHLPLDVTGLLA